MNTLNIYPSRRNQLGAAVGGLVFLAGGIWMLSQGDLAVKHAVAGWLGVVFGGGAALFLGVMLVRTYTHPRPMLRLDEKGITFFDLREKQTAVSWQQIKGFGQSRISRERFITVLLHDAETLADEQKSLMRSEVMKFNIRCCGTPYAILPASLDYPKKQLLPTLEAYHHQYR